MFVLYVTTLAFFKGCYGTNQDQFNDFANERTAKNEYSSMSRSSSKSFKSKYSIDMRIDPFNTSLSSFELQCKLGGGYFSSVYKAKKKDGVDTGCFYALKVQSLYSNNTVSMQYKMLKHEFDIEKNSIVHIFNDLIIYSKTLTMPI